MNTVTYYTEAPTPTPEQVAEAAALRAEAQENLRREEESFQRSDTDGFLTQWALSIGATKRRRQAELLDHGGTAQFPVLVYEGEVVATKVYKFADTHRPDQWNAPMQHKWRLPDELAAKLGRKWIPTGSKSRVQKQLGLTEELRWFPAYAEITTGNRKSTGLSGAANAYVAVFKKGEEPV